MKSLKRFTVALATVLFAAGILTSTASAGSGDLYDQNGFVCDVTFSYSGGAPGSGVITNVVNGSDCVVNGLHFQIHPTRTVFAANFAIDGTVSISGDLGLHVLNAIGCLLSTSAPGGGGPLSGTYSGSNFDAYTSSLKWSGQFGGFGCPDTFMPGTNDFEIRNGSI